MEDDVKICPECGAEYYAHVSMCRGCEVELVFPGEVVEKKIVAQDADPDSQLVCIEEGLLDKMSELAKELARLGVEAQVLKATAAKTCSAAEGYGLFVPQPVAEESLKAIREYWLKVHPELKETEERLDAGLCPACGAAASDSATECPDCGLYLGGGEDEESAPEEDPGCGPCGPC